MSENEKKIKSNCYRTDCGPVVTTGFNVEQYLVCTRCKEEISERLKRQIDAIAAGNEPEKDDDDTPYWGL